MNTSKIEYSYVCMLDIMGYSNMALKLPHDYLIKLYESIENKMNLTQDLSLKEDLLAGKGAVNSQLLSDSLIFWTDNDSLGRFFHLIRQLTFVIASFLASGMPVRGGVCGGSISKITMGKDDHAFSNGIVGDAIVRAYKLEQNQDWSGCIIDPGTINHVKEKIVALLPLFKDDLTFDMASPEYLESLAARLLISDKFRGQLVDYKPPLKTGRIEAYATVNWTDTFKHMISVYAKTQTDPEGYMRVFQGFPDERIRSLFGMHGKEIQEWQIERKIANTAAFYESVIAGKQRFYSLT